jgi:hypothetical protein
VRSCSLPDRAGAWQPKLQRWATVISSGHADGLKETALLSEFLTEKQKKNTRLTRGLADAETELNDRVYRLFNFTADKIKLLREEVER